ncbi:MAG TPA: hypothetical protein VMQ17_02120 [Candidatus Sulfotelmatobacter sp.]|nr:hypothetical protein [Candidatus Sulfotelmatobacter sp.]
MNIEFAVVRKKEKAAKGCGFTFTRVSLSCSLLRLAGGISDDGDRDVASNVSTDLVAGVLVLVDSLAHVVGFPVELALILLGEMAIVGSHVLFLVVLQALLTAFQTGGLSRRQLPVLHSVRDAGLLIGFTSVHLVDARMAGIDLSRAGFGSVAGLGLPGGGSGNHQTTHCQD